MQAFPTGKGNNNLRQATELSMCPSYGSLVHSCFKQAGIFEVMAGHKRGYSFQGVWDLRCEATVQVICCLIIILISHVCPSLWESKQLTSMKNKLKINTQKLWTTVMTRNICRGREHNIFRWICYPNAPQSQKLGHTDAHFPLDQNFSKLS